MAAKTQYWLFQANPKVFHLPQALRAEALFSFTVRAHKDKIKTGDRVILWYAGKQSGCYGLAEITTEVGVHPLDEKEESFFKELPEKNQPRVLLHVLYNLWDRPITKEILPNSKHFEAFYGGLPGTNFKANAKQYKELEELVLQMDQVNEAEIEYATPSWLNLPLNKILYGPPGTGKTFQTVNHALSIIENRSLEELALEDRSNLRRRFNEYMTAGQIGFVTFHPSFAYEDFVEGIRAESVKGQIFYRVRDGIFKIMATEARRCLYEAILSEQPTQKQSIEFNQLYSAFLQYLKSDTFQYFLTDKKKPLFLHRVLRFGHLAVRKAKSFGVQNVYKYKLRKLYETFENPSVLKSPDAIQSIVDKENPVAYWAVFQALKGFEAKLAQFLEQAQAQATRGEEVQVLEIPSVSNRILEKCKRYVLIIDEINRGNTAAIFGELITLLEGDKREGRREAASTVLPYSKSFFTIPPNLYLIGTMNTVDRSTDVLDIALRRRFAFHFMAPQPNLIAQMAKQPMLAGVNLKRLLQVINERLALLLDAEHQIGHAYFLDIVHLDDLKSLFEHRIIPLLKEYFFNDYGKIGLVLGKAFVIQEEKGDSSTTFADFDHPYIHEFNQNPIYKIRDAEKWTEEDFIKIYDPAYV